MVDVENMVLFEDMLSEPNRGQTFRLIWHLDLELSSRSHKVKLLFRNEKTRFYITGEIAPEFLSFCTIGSRFRDGKKIGGQEGKTFTCRVVSRDRNSILPAYKALTDDEYDLSYAYKIKNLDGSVKKIDRSSFCKHQLCLMFQEGADKIVIPCAVVGATYYFTSTSMREQVLSQNLRGLYEEATLDQLTRKASILLKPNARDDDALHIARFAFDLRAKGSWDFVMNHVRANKRKGKNDEIYCPLAADFPVEQELLLKVRGHRVPNPAGGFTLVVFEILDENSGYPFDALAVQRRRPHRLSGPAPETATRTGVNPDNRIVGDNPTNRRDATEISKPQSQSNPYHSDIVVTKELLPPRKDALLTDGVRFITEGKEEASLSPQREMEGERPTAKGYLGPKKDNNEGEKESYEMSLDDFIIMASGLGAMAGVTNLGISALQIMPQKFRRDFSKRLSLRESYDRKHNNRRKYVTVSFSYNGTNVMLVEIDQYGLPGGCSTYILVSDNELVEDHAIHVLKGYINGRALTETTDQLRKRGVSMKTKIHPISNGSVHTEKWRELLLKEIS